MGVNGSSNRGGVTGDLFFCLCRRRVAEAPGASYEQKKRRVSVDDMSDLDVFRIVFGSFVALLLFGHLSLFQCVCVHVIAI